MGDGSGRIQSPRLQSVIEPLTMLLRGDDHGRLSGSQSIPDKAAQFVEKETIFPVELDDVSGVLMISPMRHGRRRCTVCW